MATNDQAGLLKYLAEAAQEAAILARNVGASRAADLIDEAEELITLRVKIIDRMAQLELPLASPKAA